MTPEYEKQMAIAKCMIILKGPMIKIYRFGDSYTIVDKASNAKIFELKSAEYCNADSKSDEPCECLIVNKKKYLINQNDSKLLPVVIDMYTKQTQKERNKESDTEEELPETLKFLNKYIRQ